MKKSIKGERRKVKGERLFIAFCFLLSAFCSKAQVTKPDVIVSPSGPNTKVYTDLKVRGGFYLPHYSLLSHVAMQDTVGKMYINTDDGHPHIIGTDLADHKILWSTESGTGGGSGDTIYFKKFARLIGRDTVTLFTDTSATGNTFVLAQNENGYLVKIPLVYDQPTSTIAFAGVKPYFDAGIKANLPIGTGKGFVKVDSSQNVVQDTTHYYSRIDTLSGGDIANYLTAHGKNIYNTDGTLTGYRTVNENGQGLEFSSTVSSVRMSIDMQGGSSGYAEVAVINNTTHESASTGVAPDGSVSMAQSNTVTGKTQQLTISPSSGMVFQDAENNKGPVAAGRYEANYTGLSYVDKNYVDSLSAIASPILNFSNGITKSGSNVTLGGTSISQNTSLPLNPNTYVSFGDGSWNNNLWKYSIGTLGDGELSANIVDGSAGNNVTKILVDGGTFSLKSWNSATPSNQRGISWTTPGGIGGIVVSDPTAAVGLVNAGDYSATEITNDNAYMTRKAVRTYGNSLWQPVGTYIASGATAGGDLLGTYPNPTVSNSAVIGKVLTGYTSSPGTVSSSDNILQAFQKINGNEAVDAANISANTSSISSNYTAIGLKQPRIILADPGAASVTIASGDTVNMALWKLQKQINTNGANISTNTSNISTNTSNIATNTSNITALQNRNINTGTGLLGGGNLTADRTLTPDTTFLKSKASSLADYNNLMRPVKVNSAQIYNAYGDSFTNSNGATVFANGYMPLLSTFLGFGTAYNNYAVSGSGAWNAAKANLANENTGHTAFSSVMIGFNDLRHGGSSSLTLNKILNGYSSIFVNHFADSLIAAGTSDSRTVLTGTWSTNYNAASVGGKTATSGASTSANGATITRYVYGPTFAIGLIGSDGTLYTYGTASVTIDGVSYPAINENGQTDGITDGQGNDNGRMPFVKIYSGLGEGEHTVVLTTTSTNQFVVDYFAELKQPTNTTPLLIFQIPRMNATGYAISPANSSDAIVSATNSSLVSLINSWPSGYPVFIVNTGAYYTVASGQVSSDNIHPSDYGYRLLYQAAYTALFGLQKNNVIPQPLGVTALPTFAGLYDSGLTPAGIPYMGTSGLFTTNAADWNYNSSTGNVGLGVSGVNADSKFRVLHSTGAGLRIAYNGTAVNYYDATTHHVRTAAGGGIADLSSTSATFYEKLLSTTNGTVDIGASGNAWAKFWGTGVNIQGATGVISILPQSAAGTYNFNLPTTAGTAWQVLTSQGGSSAAMTWSSVPIIQANNDLTAQTTAGNITTFTVGSSTATFNVSAYLNVTAITTDVIQVQITYTDENNTAQTVSLANISAIGNSTYSPVTIRAKNGTVITAKTNLSTSGGTITYDAGARIAQL